MLFLIIHPLTYNQAVDNIAISRIFSYVLHLGNIFLHQAVAYSPPSSFQLVVKRKVGGCYSLFHIAAESFNLFGCGRFVASCCSGLFTGRVAVWFTVQPGRICNICHCQCANLHPENHQNPLQGVRRHAAMSLKCTMRCTVHCPNAHCVCEGGHPYRAQDCNGNQHHSILCTVPCSPSVPLWDSGA